MSNPGSFIPRLQAVGPADSLGQRLVLVRQAGAGGMGRVYQATDEATGAALAVKLIAHVRGETAVARFAAEAEILESLDHPAIVAYVGHGTTRDGDHYLAMAWLEGGDLGQRLARGPLSVEDTVSLGLRVADGLAAAHRAGVIHRDLKPSNIVLVDGDVARATLVDFGVARRIGEGGVTRTGELVGTPGYMAPEQVRGHRDLDGRSDLFALGCVLYHSLAGKPPFGGEDVMTVLARLLLEDVPRLARVRDDVPRRLETLIRRLLAKDGAQRPASADEVLAELCVIAGRPAPGVPLSDAPTMAGLRPRRRRWWLGLAVVPVIAGAAMVWAPEPELLPVPKPLLLPSPPPSPSPSPPPSPSPSPSLSPSPSPPPSPRAPRASRSVAAPAVTPVPVDAPPLDAPSPSPAPIDASPEAAQPPADPNGAVNPYE